MLFQIDRVQRVEVEKDIQYHIFEFIKIIDFEKFKENLINGEEGKYKFFSDIDKKKVKYLLKGKLESICKIHIIIYEEGIDKYFLISNENTKVLRCKEYSFNHISYWFKELNKKSLQKSESKPLGSAKDDDVDSYVNNIIQSINGYEKYDDDCGIGLTKKLLSSDSTSATDFDLFQYIESTDEYIIYEFLKRENENITNKQAHPMRYCWTNSSKDNKMKFISLWRAKKFFNARLYLINYSDDVNEEISILEVLELDKNKGIRKELKYCLTYNEFIQWLSDMNTYNNKEKDYLKKFKHRIYDSKYFDNFNLNKRTYGIENE